MNLMINNSLDDFCLSEDFISRIENYILACLEVEDFTRDLELSLSFVGQDEIRNLNKAYRGKDSITDVLSFPSWDEINRVLGDIVICIPWARDQAKEIGNSLEDEIIYLIVHSVFHLLGYDHMDGEDKELMRGKEKEALKLGEANA